MDRTLMGNVNMLFTNFLQIYNRVIILLNGLVQLSTYLLMQHKSIELFFVWLIETVNSLNLDLNPSPFNYTCIEFPGNKKVYKERGEWYLKQYGSCAIYNSTHCWIWNKTA